MKKLTKRYVNLCHSGHHGHVVYTAYFYTLNCLVISLLWVRALLDAHVRLRQVLLAGGLSVFSMGSVFAPPNRMSET